MINRTPVEQARSINTSLFLSQRNDAFFKELDEERDYSIEIGNAAYVLSQAEDLFETIQRIEWGEAEYRAGYLANARSDVSRIVTILARLCIDYGWDFLDVLAEGVEYEAAVIEDIRAGRRARQSHKGQHLLDAARAKWDTDFAAKYYTDVDSGN